MARSLLRRFRRDPDLVLNLPQNSLFIPIRRVQSTPFLALMEGLYIDEWSDRELNAAEGLVNQLCMSRLLEINRHKKRSQSLQLWPSENNLKILSLT